MKQLRKQQLSQSAGAQEPSFCRLYCAARPLISSGLLVPISQTLLLHWIPGLTDRASMVNCAVTRASGSLVSSRASTAPARQQYCGVTRPAAWNPAPAREAGAAASRQLRMSVAAQAAGNGASTKRGSRRRLSPLPCCCPKVTSLAGPSQRAGSGRLGSGAGGAAAARSLLLLSPSAAQRATAEGKKAILDKVDCFIFDCDGVIWRGDSVIDGVPETLDMLRGMASGAAAAAWQ